MDIYFMLLVFPAFIFAMFSQLKVKSTFKKYSRLSNSRNMTGAQVSRMILDRNGLYDVSVEQVEGNLTDHYDPRTKRVRLSENVYYSTSIAAIGVAAHETGHAVGYAPLGLRAQG